MSDEDVCTRGHARNVHGNDPTHPASTACWACPCIAYEPEEQEEDDAGE